MAQKYNLTMDQGSEFQATFPLRDVAANVAANVSNYSGEGQFRKHYTSLTAHDLEVSLSNNSVIIYMSSQDNETITPGRYLYDVEIRNSSTNAVFRVVEGIITVTPNITRAANT